MMSNEKMWRNCSNSEMLEMLKVCPEVIDELRNMRYKDLFSAYDSILPKYNMDWSTYPVYKGESDEILFFEYRYVIDGKVYNMNGDWGYKTNAKAQIEAVHATMYELRERIRIEKKQLLN